MSRKDAAAAIAFYQAAFGAEEMARVVGEDGLTVLRVMRDIYSSVFCHGAEIPLPLFLKVDFV